MRESEKEGRMNNKEIKKRKEKRRRKELNNREEIPVIN